MEEKKEKIKENDNMEKEAKETKELKVKNIPDFIKSNRLRISKVVKKYIKNKYLSPAKNDPIKVKLSPLIKRNEEESDDPKELSYTYRLKNDFNTLLYLSPSPKEKSFDNKTMNELNPQKERTNPPIPKTEKIQLKKNFNTPYRKINIRQKRETISPSANVIIKNFNYNNVYNINIDNDKNKDNIKNINNNSKNKEKNNINRFSHKYITYNKPKTTTNMNIQCVISKKELKNITPTNKLIKNTLHNKKDTFYSRFISEGKYLKNEKDNIIISSTLNNINNNYFNLNEEKILSNKNKNIISKNNSKISNQTVNDENYTGNNNNNIKNFYLNDNKSFSYLNAGNGKNKNNSNNIQQLSLNIDDFNNNTNKASSPKVNNPYSTEIKNNLEKFKFTNIISFNLNDINILEEKINNIILIFNNDNNINYIETYNNCYEFIIFYDKSSIKGIFSSFFKANNKLIIESSINLSLFSIIVIFHLSKNKLLSKDAIKIINNILYLLKINFALYIKKIQLDYKINNSNKNYIYFQSYNNFLIKNKIINLENEVDITFKIYQNCKHMTNGIKLIMEIYKQININYYNNFIKIFNNISIQKENELINYFFTKICKKRNSNNIISLNQNKNNKTFINDILNNNNIYKLKRNKTNITNITSGIFSPKKKSIFENLSIKKSNISVKNALSNTIKRKKKENINKLGIGISIPYIKAPSKKKYTLILDLNKTLVYYNNEEGKINIKLRDGLFSFLSMIKIYYELISFSNEPKNITEAIIKEIESEKKYFDFYLNRENCILYENNLVKDISLIGRDISKVIIIDDDENCFKLNKENGIKISNYNGNNNDNILFELKKILILIYKKNYDDIRIALKDFSNDIKNKITLA